MNILFTILKISGSILGILVAILFLLILLVLLVPIRYEIVGVWEDDTKEISVHARWLLGLLSFRGMFASDEKGGIVRLLGIPIFRVPHAEKKKKVRHKKENPAKNKESSTKIAGQQESDAHEDEIAEEIRNFKQSEPSAAPQEEKTAKKRGVWNRLREFCCGIAQKIKNLIKNIAHVKELIYDEGNKLAVLHMIKELKYLISHFGPRKIVADVRFSAGDPALTGQVLGIVCLFPVLYRYDMGVVPDFETETFYIKGNCKVKGYVRFLHGVRSGIHLFRDKNIRKWIKK